MTFRRDSKVNLTIPTPDKTTLTPDKICERMHMKECVVLLISRPHKICTTHINFTGLSESVAIDGKPRPGLPNRRLLWDLLKPMASAVRSNHSFSTVNLLDSTCLSRYPAISLVPRPTHESLGTRLVHVFILLYDTYCTASDRKLGMA